MTEQEIRTILTQTKRIFCYGSHTFPEIPGKTAGKIKGFPAAP